jgi:hypothetical protein
VSSLEGVLANAEVWVVQGHGIGVVPTWRTHTVVRVMKRFAYLDDGSRWKIADGSPFGRQTSGRFSRRPEAHFPTEALRKVRERHENLEAFAHLFYRIDVLGREARRTALGDSDLSGVVAALRAAMGALEQALGVGDEKNDSE